MGEIALQCAREQQTVNECTKLFEVADILKLQLLAAEAEVTKLHNEMQQAEEDTNVVKIQQELLLNNNRLLARRAKLSWYDGNGDECDVGIDLDGDTQLSTKLQDRNTAARVPSNEANLENRSSEFGAWKQRNEGEEEDGKENVEEMVDGSRYAKHAEKMVGQWAQFGACCSLNRALPSGVSTVELPSTTPIAEEPNKPGSGLEQEESTLEPVASIAKNDVAISNRHEEKEASSRESKHMPVSSSGTRTSKDTPAKSNIKKKRSQSSSKNAVVLVDDRSESLRLADIPLINDEDAVVALGSCNAHGAQLYYCGRHLGESAIPDLMASAAQIAALSVGHALGFKRRPRRQFRSGDHDELARH